MKTALALTISTLLTLGGLPAVKAEEHADEALKHANEAANALGDSRSVREHAAEALKHIEAAKESHAQQPEVIEHLKKGEAELKDAIEHASHYNATTATDTAGDAKEHLERAQDAAGTAAPAGE
jgi:Small metal-binding protein